MSKQKVYSEDRMNVSVVDSDWKVEIIAPDYYYSLIPSESFEMTVNIIGNNDFVFISIGKETRKIKKSGFKKFIQYVHDLLNEEDRADPE